VRTVGTGGINFFRTRDVDAPEDRTSDAPPPTPSRRQGDLREETALLRLVATLGLGVVLGIVVFFFGAVWLDRRLQLGGALVAPGVVIGVLLSFYWTYLSIARHLKRFGPDTPDKGESRG
jgi:hypothetical protein